MATSKVKPGDTMSASSPIMAALKAAESEAAASTEHTKKYAARLQKARHALETGKSAVSVVSALTEDLRQLPHFPSITPPQKLSDQLSAELDGLRRSLESNVSTLIQEQARASGLPTKVLADGLGVGPFKVRTDAARLVASLDYAHSPLVSSIPLDAQVIVAAVLEAKKALFEGLPEIRTMAQMFEQALRVAWVRKHRSLPIELRVDLPALYREMALLRMGGPDQGRGAVLAYSLGRFVVELKTLLQSTHNLEGSLPMRPEAAVIENAKDPRKSVFFPNDLECGYGEGKYFQAIVQRQG